MSFFERILLGAVPFGLVPFGLVPFGLYRSSTILVYCTFWSTVPFGLGPYDLKGEQKKRVRPKFDPTLEGERFVLGGCPSHRLLYS